MYGEFQKLAVEVLGVSPDSEASHRKFIEEIKIPYTLLCDPDKNMMTTYDAFGEKKMYGKISKGVIRSTIWVAPDGTVKKHWSKVAKAADHAAKVLATLQSEM